MFYISPTVCPQERPKILSLPSKTHHHLAPVSFTSFISYCLSWLRLPKQNTINQLGGLNSKHFLTVLEAGKAKIKVRQSSVAGESLPPGFQTVTFSLCFLHGGERQRKRDLSTVLSDQGSTFMTSFNCSYLLKNQSPDTFTLCMKASSVNFGEHSSIRSSHLNPLLQPQKLRDRKYFSLFLQLKIFPPLTHLPLPI